MFCVVLFVFLCLDLIFCVVWGRGFCFLVVFDEDLYIEFVGGGVVCVFRLSLDFVEESF